MKKKTLFLIFIIALALIVIGTFSIVFAGGAAEKPEKEEGPITLRILYFQWDPGTAVQKTALGYEEATGGRVKVVTELPGFGEWYSK